jgi:small subunit ribosomal protein S21
VLNDLHFGAGMCVRGVLFRLQEYGPTVQVLVRDNNVDQALRALKKKLQREGVFREMKLRRNYEKPSERRAREKAEAMSRHRKLLRKRLDREGY